MNWIANINGEVEAGLATNSWTLSIDHTNLGGEKANSPNKIVS